MNPAIAAWRPFQDLMNATITSAIETIEARPILRTYGYARVSTDRQGLSLAAQQDQIRAMAVVKGVELADIIVDEDQSGKSLGRPGVELLLRHVDSGVIKTVIIAKLDRLTRSVKDLAIILERFQKAGASLVSVNESLDTGSAAGRLVLNVMASVSQWELEAIGERTRVGLGKLRDMGRFTGKPRYGWRVPGAESHVKGEKYAKVPIEEDPVEQENIETIRKMRHVGATFRHIADALNDRGRTVRSGAAWSVNDVQRVAKAS